MTIVARRKWELNGGIGTYLFAAFGLVLTTDGQDLGSLWRQDAAGVWKKPKNAKISANQVPSPNPGTVAQAFTFGCNTRILTFHAACCRNGARLEWFYCVAWYKLWKREQRRARKRKNWQWIFNAAEADWILQVNALVFDRDMNLDKPWSVEDCVTTNIVGTKRFMRQQ